MTVTLGGFGVELNVLCWLSGAHLIAGVSSTVAISETAHDLQKFMSSVIKLFDDFISLNL
ncbi:hypothetical protein [Photobacterium marinum]|uniref:hypothetical protein n=1 Tax=Photobacterium marinum TaxID=1056511 RepID=UPI00031B587D|nr:hypothetical protein [Photobacterium marinum]